SANGVSWKYEIFAAVQWPRERQFHWRLRRRRIERVARAVKILAGNSNRSLTESIAAYLGVPLTKCQVRRFADLEVFVEIQENVRGQDTFVVQSTSFPANDHLMEVLIMTDALRRA